MLSLKINRYSSLSVLCILVVNFIYRLSVDLIYPDGLNVINTDYSMSVLDSKVLYWPFQRFQSQVWTSWLLCVFVTASNPRGFRLWLHLLPHVLPSILSRHPTRPTHVRTVPLRDPTLHRCYSRVTGVFPETSTLPGSPKGFNPTPPVGKHGVYLGHSQCPSFPHTRPRPSREVVPFEEYSRPSFTGRSSWGSTIPSYRKSDLSSRPVDSSRGSWSC